MADAPGSSKKLLSLDGGGVKGISSLMILQAIMREVQRIEQGPASIVNQSKPGFTVTSGSSNRELKPVEYFDLTGGTSTGGIIAVMLNRLEMDCGDAIKVYTDLSDQIFAVRLFGVNVANVPILKWFSGLILKVKLLFGSQYSAKYLNKSIDDVVCKHLKPGDEFSKDGDLLLVAPRFHNPNAKGKMLMCATIEDAGKALLFRDYTPPPDAVPETDLTNKGDPHHPPQAPRAPPYSDPGRLPAGTTDENKKLLHSFDYDCVSVKQAVRATSAAPTYLPSENIQGIDFWDGGLLNNNPIDQVWSARYDLAESCHTEPYVSTVISLGCTWNEESTKKPMGIISRLLGILNKSLAFATNTQAKHLDFKRNIYRRNLRQPPHKCTSYFRFNAPIGKKDVNLADYAAIPFLIQKTQDFLDCEDTKCKIKAAAFQLAKVNNSGEEPPEYD